MSIKIYNGYRVKLGGRGLPTFGNDIRSILQPMLRQQLWETVFNEVILLFNKGIILTDQGLESEKIPQGKSALQIFQNRYRDNEVYKEIYEFSFVCFDAPKSEDNTWTYFIAYPNISYHHRQYLRNLYETSVLYE